MTWYLGTEGSQTDPETPTERAPVPTVSERFSAAVTLGRIEDNAWRRKQGFEADLHDELYDLLPEDLRYPVSSGASLAGADAVARARLDRLLPALAEAKSRDPEQFTSFPGSDLGWPTTEEEFNAIITARRRQEYDDATAVLAAAPEGSWGAELMGGMWAGLTEETSLLTLPLGAPGGASLAKTILYEGAAGAFGEYLISDRRSQTADELDLDQPVLSEDMAFAFVTAGAFGGALKSAEIGVRRLSEYRASRAEGAEAARNGDVTPAEHEGRVEETARALAEGKPIPEDPAPRIPEITADAPPNWERIRNGIFAGESGGDYDALFGFQNRPGGRYQNVKLTEMTVDEAIEFSNPRGEYGQWVKEELRRLGLRPRVATPMGAYQIVGTTLRAAKRELGLRGDEVMTPELQERLGHWIYRQQGTGAWEGYRGPRDTFTPRTGNAAPASSGTSRAYTRSGQVRAGDEFTIDVDYDVVDAGSLRPASGRLQPRDRSRTTSDVWIADTAARLDPAQLLPTSTADRGTPIVGPDNVIESGNGRFAAIARAYDQHPDRGAEYRSAIEAAGYVVPEGVTRPVLVAKRRTSLTDAQRESFVVAAQDSGVARMTPTEVARSSARAMTAERLATFAPGGGITDPENGGFVRSVLGALPRSERNALFDTQGALNAEGTRRLKQAFFARAWDAPDILQRYAEVEDAGELRSLMTALEEAAPSWATLIAEVEAGAVRAEFDISGHVLDAMRLIAKARDEAGRAGGKADAILAELLEDVDLLEGALSPLTTSLVGKFWSNGRATSAPKVAEFLRNYADEARKAGRVGDMLSDVTPARVLRTVDDKTFKDLPEEFGPPRGAPMATPEPIPDGAFPEGALSQDAEQADLEALGGVRGDGDGAENIAEMIEAAKSDYGEMELRLDDDTSIRASEILDDLAEDGRLLRAIDVCYLKGAA